MAHEYYKPPELPPLWYSKAARWISDRKLLWILLAYILFFFVWPIFYREPMDPGADIMIDDFTSPGQSD